MAKYIIIEGDYNDADYVSEKTKIDDETIEQLRPIIEVVKLHDGSWGTSEYADSKPEDEYENELTKEQIEFLNKYVPRCGDDDGYGIHTIESIEIVQLIEKLY